MVLPSAPCPKCRAVIVLGQRQCLRCHERFDYGANPPPEPSMQQIQEVWAQIQNAAAAASAPAPAPVAPTNPAVAPNPTSPHPSAPRTNAPAAPQATVAPATVMAGGAGAQPNAQPRTQMEAQETFIDRGRYEYETATAQQLDVSLHGIFEPTTHLDADALVAPVASLPGLEITSFEAETLNNPEASIAQASVAQKALCIDCGVPYASGQCPSCGRVAR